MDNVHARSRQSGSDYPHYFNMAWRLLGGIQVHTIAQYSERTFGTKEEHAPSEIHYCIGVYSLYPVSDPELFDQQGCATEYRNQHDDLRP